MVMVVIMMVIMMMMTIMMMVMMMKIYRKSIENLWIWGISRRIWDGPGMDLGWIWGGSAFHPSPGDTPFFELILTRTSG